MASEGERPGEGGTQAPPAGEHGEHADGQREDRGHKERWKVLDSHGTRTTREVATATSSPSASRPKARNGRVRSDCLV